PLSPRPVRVSVNVVAPGATLEGDTPSTTGSISTETGALTPSVTASGDAAATLTAAPMVRSRVSGGVTAAMLAGRAEMNTFNGGSTVTVADALSEASSWCVAVTVTTAGTGITGGAMWTPSALIVPRAGSPPGRPLTAHRTLVMRTPASVATKVA